MHARNGGFLNKRNQEVIAEARLLFTKRMFAVSASSTVNIVFKCSCFRRA